MHQLIDKKNKIVLYLLILLILSTTSVKFTENQNNFSSKINQINIEGLSNIDNNKIFKELNNLIYVNILLVSKEEIHRVIEKYDIILAMYHDQGLAPFKALSFGKGVNITLGLPFIRTSVDHGTAFDIVGTKKISTSSFYEALNIAIQLSQ